MRVQFQPALALPSAALLALSLLLGAGCASEGLEEPAPQGDPNPSGGNQSSAGSGSAAAGPDYRRQDYPAGPYGVGLGSTLEDFAFLGWRDPVTSEYDLERMETVRLSEFYNPDGRSDVKLIWINASAVWCTVCRAEMRDINIQDIKGTMGPKGLQLIETLFEDNDSLPAKPLDLQKWGQVVDHSIDFPLLLDPGFKLGAFFTSDATPLNMLVDARTMRILDATMGYSSDYWERVDEYLSKL
ncbi:MAG TPA: hypothetical protein VEX18_04550 [Polyangiaceae bacterium]|nr:hypothetical protein [Polyangiaceae bacterium]